VVEGKVKVIPQSLFFSTLYFNSWLSHISLRLSSLVTPNYLNQIRRSGSVRVLERTAEPIYYLVLTWKMSGCQVVFWSTEDGMATFPQR
jgi:hypothetical protein